MTLSIWKEGKEVVMHGNLVRKAAIKFLGKNYIFWVDDITQDVLVKAFLNLHKFNDSKGSIESWLFAMTRNTCFDFMAKKVNSLTNVTLDEFSFSFSEGEKMIDSKDLRQKTRYALDRLSEVDRKFLLLKYFFNYSGKEIAQLTGIAENQIPVRMNRARDRMRGILERECGF